MKIKIRKSLAFLMTVIMLLSFVSVGAVAKDAAPLFTVDDISARQGDEVSFNIKIAQAVSASSNQINALDVSLKYDKDVFELLSVSRGAGLNNALDKVKNAERLFVFNRFVNVRFQNTPILHFTKR